MKRFRMRCSTQEFAGAGALVFGILLGLLAPAGAQAQTAGNLLLRLTDGISGQALADQNVVVWEVLEDGERVHRASRVTDALGQAEFTIGGLGDGRNFVVRTKPFLDRIEVPIPGPGILDVPAGVVGVTLVHGVTGAALAGVEATVLAMGPDGSLESVGRHITDAAGGLRLDPAGLGQRSFRIRAPSPVDGTQKLSEPIAAPGSYRIPVGNAPLTVQVVYDRIELPLESVSVQVYEIGEAGTRTRVRVESTDADGRVVMDLDGLGAGRRYVVRTQPYVQWVEQEVAAPGSVELRAGTLTVRLMDQDEGLPLADRSVVLQRKLPSGQLDWTAEGTTGTAGRVRFDPVPVPGEAAVYVLTVNGPFGGGERYISAPVTALGAVTFPVSRGGPADFDRRPPAAEFLTPDTVVAAGTLGFSLAGYATDDRALRDVQVELRGPRGEREVATASYDAESTRWTIQLAPAWFRAGDTVSVRVQARDQFYNAVVLERSLNVLEDLDPPTIGIQSHASGDQVHDRGVLVRGAALDATEVSGLTAMLTSGAEVVMAERSVEVEPGSGRWAVALPADLLAGRGAVRLRLRATDSSGNIATQNLDLDVSPVANPIPHLVARISFGETAASLAEARELGYAGYLARQLDPGSIDDRPLERRLAAEPLETIGDLRTQQVLRAIYSERQLLELMTWFWENHFNTDFSRHNTVAWEAAENRDFRRNALGRFRTLLGNSATSPAMLYYLDGRRNRVRDPNENYARELLELHTIGLSAGYDQADVDAVARAFTGWTVQDGEFYFDETEHDSDPKTVLGVSLGARGIGEGREVLDLLAQHPATARRVCDKLVAMLLTDAPPGALVRSCADTFLANADAPDQIARVLAVVIDSPAFRAARLRHGKMKTPIRFLTGTVRGLDVSGSGRYLAADLIELGQTPFGFAIPTGYPVLAEDWASGNLLMARLAFAGRMLESRPEGERPYLAVHALLDEPEVVPTAEGIAGYLLMRLNNEDFDREDFDAALGVLSEEGLVRFDIRAPGADVRLTRLLRTLLSLPRYQLY